MAPALGESLSLATLRLAGVASARLEAELLLAMVLQKPRSFLYSHPEYVLTSAQQSAYDGLIKRRVAGEPVAYITGTRGFWTLDLQVTSAVLIPRPETELLVELALACGELPGDDAQIADLGTGSGAIALALASERPHWQVFATDRSAAALQVAAGNATRLGLHNVVFCQGNWCDALPAGLSLDMMVSNPPYVEAGDPHLQQSDLRFEPSSALVASEHGLSDLAILCEQAVQRLKPGAWLLLEHGKDQGESVRGLLKAQDFRQIRTERDLSGHDRVSLACRPRPGLQ
jgi:release factor glutamine methyltransferase